MSSQAECESRLQNLQQYIPFLQKMLQRLDNAPGNTTTEQKQKMTSLLTVITSSGQQLRPETLDRCEEVLSKMYLKFEGEDITRSKTGFSSEHFHSNVTQFRTEGSRPGTNLSRSIKEERIDSTILGGQDDETPRSPSPEETNRVSSSYVPISIPVVDFRSMDTDERVSHSYGHGNIPGRDSHGCSPSVKVPYEASPRSLRNEPVEIPLRSKPNEDQDYRRVFERNQLDQRHLSKESRAGSYKNPEIPQPGSGLSDISPAAASSPRGTVMKFGDPRFNPSYERDPRDYNDPSASQLHHTGSWTKDRHHPGSFQPMRNDWSANAPFDPRSNTRSNGDIPQRPDEGRRVGPYRDVDFRSPPNQSGKGLVPHQRSPMKPDRWHKSDDIKNQTGSFDNVWESFSTKSRSPFPQSTNWAPVSGHDRPNSLGNSSSGWSQDDSPASTSRGSNFEWDSFKGGPPGMNRGFRNQSDERNPYDRNYEQYSAQGDRPSHGPQHNSYARPHPSGGHSKYSGGQAKPPSNLPPPRREDPQTKPSSNLPRRDDPQTKPVSNPPAPRREDPRLSNRPKPNPNPSTSSDNSPVGATSSKANSTIGPRSAGPKDHRAPPLKDSEPKIRPPSSNSDVERPSSKSATESNNKSSSRKDDFASPLDRLYSSGNYSNASLTGKGYGSQTFRIPKKKKSDSRINSAKNVDKTLPSGHQQLVEETIDSAADSAPSKDEAAGSNASNPEASPSQSTTTTEEPNKESQPIPIEVIQSYLKTVLPQDVSEQVLKQLEKVKGNSGTPTGNSKSRLIYDTDTTDDEEKSKTVTSAEAQVSSNVCSDQTVSSTNSLVEAPSGVVAGNADSEVSLLIVDTSSDQASAETKRRGRKKKNATSSLEVARLHEDLVDYMPNLDEISSRRRSRSQRVTQERQAPQMEDSDSDVKGFTDSSSTPRKSPLVEPTKKKRGRPRRPQEHAVEEPEPEPESDVQPAMQQEAVEADSIVSDPSFEPAMTEEEAPSTTNAIVGGPKRAKRKKKSPNGGQKKVKLANDSREIGAGSGQKKSVGNKKKKTFTPTRLSLRGKRSMYENEVVTDPESAQLIDGVPAEEYFKCKECEFLGQKIIHHYVNEHPKAEIPFATVPEAQWTWILEQEATSSPLAVSAELLRDLSWIPARHSVATATFCRLCTYSSCLRSELLEHFMTHALPNDRKFRCNVCGQSEDNFFDMFDHVTGHTGEYRYQCNYCNYRVGRRNCIKQHMASLHSSQDVLFYNVTLPDVNRLWIDGHVCLTCRYVQINGQHVDRHVTSNETCVKGHKKVNLISVECVEQEATMENIPLKNREEINIFLGPSLDAAYAESAATPADMHELANTLRKSSVPLIEKLVEKLAKEENDQADSKPNPPVPLTAPVRRPLAASRSESIADASDSKSAEEKRTEETSNEADKEVCEPSLAVPEAWMKSTSSLLATTISKLTDKLGNTCDSTQASPGPSSPDDQTESLTDGELADSSSSSLDEEEEEMDESEELEDSDDDCLMIEHIQEEDESPSLPCIADVISLNATNNFDSVNDLDPIRLVLPFSNVIIGKDECTFPYRMPHDRPHFAASLKKPKVYQSMMENRRIRDFFKCMGYNCIFSSDLIGDFNVHLHWHRKEYLSPHLTQAIPEHRTLVCAAEKLTTQTLSFPDFHLCCYCPQGASSIEELVNHVEKLHGDCSFQCSACFFRSWSHKIVDVHIGVAHSDKPGAQVLKCKQVASACKQNNVPVLTVCELARYQCSFENCKFECVFGKNFVDHLRLRHANIQTVTCSHCSSPVNCTNEEYSELMRHFNSHGIGFFQCALCHWGSDLAVDMLRHLCLSHPSLRGRVLIRSPLSVPTPIKTLAKYLPPRLRPFGQASKNPHDPTDLTNDIFRDLFNSVETVESDPKVDEDVGGMLTDGNTGDPQSDDIRAEAEKIPENGTEFYGFGEDERAKAREKSESIMAEADNADDFEDPASVAAGASEEPGTSVEDAGLSGHNLYKCGNAGCDYTADTSNELKDHLLVCDLARDSRLLTCHHCGRSMKQVSNLLEHLKVHGPKRYSCGLCGHRGPVAIIIRKHMKTVHRCGVIDMVPVGRGPVSADSGHFTFYPKDMAKKLQDGRSRTRNLAASSKQKQLFSFEDIAKIPMRSILPFSVECKHCGYTSKVRANMIRHLSLHEKNAERSSGSSSDREELVPRVVIPELAPVNPVPHLEGKEKMFDKMTNLAYSSHAREGVPAPAKMGGRMAGPGGEKAEEDPTFVPDHLRYVCGFDGCSHLTSSETLLKYHLQTLHNNDTFTCPHCPAGAADSSDLNAETYRTHLKIHGPRLYRCGHCTFYHWQTAEIERHLSEKHSNRSPWQITVREPNDQEVRNSARSQTSNKSSDPNALPWHCSMCKQTSASCSEILAHVQSSHGIMSQFKCALCPVRCNVRSEFDRHFASRHPDNEVQVLSMFYRIDETEKKSNPPEPATRPVVTKPLWKKNEPRLRHIRGILLEEDDSAMANSKAENDSEHPDDPVYGPYGTPSNGLLCCPMCKNYTVAYNRDFKDHLYRELQYKKFLCSKCNFGGASRMHVMRHIEKQHAKDGTFIREIAPNQALEEWVEKVVKIQVAMLKKTKTGAGGVKAKKNLPATSKSTAATASSSTATSGAKGKKNAVPAVSMNEGAVAASKEPADVDMIRVKLEPTASSKTSASEFVCPQCTFTTGTLLQFRKHEASHKNESAKEFSCNFAKCEFQADSELLLETHVRFAHSTEASAICLQCGTKAADNRALLEHFQKTGHSKSNSARDARADLDMQSEIKEEILNVKKEVNSSPTKMPRKGRSKAFVATLPYRCKHCDFRGASENGINLHWQWCHSADNKPLDFVYEPQPGAETGVKVNYKCQHCNTQGQFEELKKHSESSHPNMEVRIIRITGKKRPTETVDLTSEEPLTKKSSGDSTPTASTSGEEKQPSTSRPASPGLEVVFVVAPQPPQFICNWCQARFTTENEIIRHHIEHPSSLALRYTRIDHHKSAADGDQQTEGSETSRTIMEIRFGCPVCKKRFESLGAARGHVSEHQQAWKCGHCIQLFASPTNALQHIKEAHPGLMGRLESIDSPNLVAEKLTKGITMHRIQVSMKSLLKDKSQSSSHIQSVKKEVKGHTSTSACSTLNSIKVEESDPKIGASARGLPAVARKSASVNLFLREPVKQEGPSLVGDVFDPSGPVPAKPRRQPSFSGGAASQDEIQSNATQRPISMGTPPLLVSAIKMEKL